MSPLASRECRARSSAARAAGAAQAPLLPLELLRADGAAKRGQSPEPDDDGAADGDARRNGEALEHCDL